MKRKHKYQSIHFLLPNPRLNRTGQGVKRRKFHAILDFRLKCGISASLAGRLAASRWAELKIANQNPANE
jgi:hypothetical protein